jgi:hypothetical protein
MSTLLLAEGLISEEESGASATAADRFEAGAGADVDAETATESGDLFEEAHSMIDRSIERGVLSPADAAEFRSMFRRIERDLGPESTRRPPLRSVPPIGDPAG